MTWQTFYLICFFVGLFLSAFSLLGGMGHFGGHVHIPHAPHVPHLPGAAHVPHMPHAGAAGTHGAGATASGGGSDIPWWNGFSIMVFLCWFGAAGYLLTRYGGFVAGVVLVIAAVCGVAGGAIVFFFLVKVLMPHDRELTADETAVTGVVGRVTSTIREGGTGEIIYEQLGARRSAPARSEDGTPIPKEEEVYVVRYEKGIAYVRRWEEALESREQGSGNREQALGTKGLRTKGLGTEGLRD
jgi:membrane protein implicated in regulation of membrane protease activity